MRPDNLSQFDRVAATFAPRRTDDLRPGVDAWVGRAATWVAWKRIPAGHDYAGEWAMLPEGGVLAPTRWAPLGDLEVVGGGGRRAMKLTRCRFEFKKEDAWVGIFWKTTYATTDRGEEPMATDVWICLLPCVPLHLAFFHRIAIPFAPEESTDDQAAA